MELGQLEDNLLMLSDAIRELKLGVGPDLASIMALYPESEDRLLESLNKLGIKYDQVYLICDPGYLPFEIPNSTIVGHYLLRYAAERPQELIERSFTFLLTMFQNDIRTETYVPDIITTLTFIKLLKALNIDAKYDSFLKRTGLPIVNDITNNINNTSIINDDAIRIIPCIRIDDVYFNVYGIELDADRPGWKEYFAQNGKIKKYLNDKAVSLTHRPYCSHSNKKYEIKIEDLLINNFEKCKCAVKPNAHVLLDSFMRESTAELNNYLKFTGSSKSATPLLYRLRYPFHGKMTYYSIIRRAFYKSLIVHLFQPNDISFL